MVELQEAEFQDWCKEQQLMVDGWMIVMNGSGDTSFALVRE